MHLSLAAATLALAAACAAHAQLIPKDGEWREADAPPPPLPRLEGIVPLDIVGSALRFGVPPESLSLGADHVVRYVVVATNSSGAFTGLYEGLRCDTGEFKVYSRYNPSSGWTMVKDAQWKSLRDTPVSRHTLVIAKDGACIGHGTNTSAAQILRDLRRPAGTSNSN